MENYNDREFINIGSGEDLSILDLAKMVREIVGYTGEILFDSKKPDGTPRKLMDVSKLNALGWSSSTKLQEGIEIAYRDFVSRPDSDT
jgi:GDP-L-fucose synthase